MRLGFLKRFLLIISATIAITSCSNIENDFTDKNVFIINGKLGLSEDAKSFLHAEKNQTEARTAIPGISKDDIEYSLTATRKSDNMKKDAVVSSTEFKLSLEDGEWELNAKGFIETDGVKKQVLWGSKTLTITPEAELNCDMELKLSMEKTKGNGSLNLTFQCPTDQTVKKVVVERFKVGSSTCEEKTTIDTFVNSEGIYVVDSLPPGIYSLRFEYYNEMERLIFQSIETANVFSNLATTEWQLGNKSFIANGNFPSTIQTEFFVSKNGNDDNCGSFFAPVKTLEKAMTLAAESSILKPDEIINVCLMSNIDNVASSLNGDMKLKIYSQSTTPCIIKAKKDSTAIKVIGRSKLTLSNVKITGGNSENGGGIFVENATLNLEDNVEISGNKAKNGGGVYLSDNAVMSIKGKITIKENYISSTTSKSNVEFKTANQKISITGNISESEIGVKTNGTEKGTEKIITSGFSANNTTDAQEIFSSDDGFLIGTNGTEATIMKMLEMITTNIPDDPLQSDYGKLFMEDGKARLILTAPESECTIYYTIAQVNENGSQSVIIDHSGATQSFPAIHADSVQETLTEVGTYHIYAVVEKAGCGKSEKYDREFKVVSIASIGGSITDPTEDGLVIVFSLDGTVTQATGGTMQVTITNGKGDDISDKISNVKFEVFANGTKIYSDRENITTSYITTNAAQKFITFKPGLPSGTYIQIFVDAIEDAASGTTLDFTVGD